MEWGSANLDRNNERMSQYRQKLGEMDLKELVREFFTYLDYREDTDSGTEFSPVIISSCRCLLNESLNELLEKMREVSNG